MPSVVLDHACFLLRIDEKNAEESACLFVEKLLSLRRFSELGISTLVEKDTWPLLTALADFPTWDKLKAELAILKKIIQSKDLIEILNSLLERAPSLNEVSGVNEIIIEDFESVPALPATGLENNQIEHIQKSLGHTLILKERAISEQKKEPIYFADFYGTQTARKIDVTTNCILEHFDGSKILCEDRLLKNSICSISEPQLLLEHFELSYLWINAREQKHYERILQLSIDSVLPPPQQHSKKWSLGTSFLQSAKPYGFLSELARAKCLLRACTETITGKKLEDTHALRNNDGPSSGQKQRDGKKAWRRDIDYEFHLHYWESPESITLANVVTHKDTTICWD